MPLDLHSMSKAADGGARVEAAENRDAEDGARLQEVGARLAAAGERAARPPSATARDILADWADWAAEAGCAASRRGILQRGQRLARLLEGGVDLNSAPRRAAARRRSSDFGAPSAPEGLAARIVERVTWLFPPAGIVDDGRARIYVVPYWLVHPQPERRLGAIHVRIGAAASEFRIVDGETRAPPPMDVMRSIALRRKRPADGRRDSMVRVARVLAAELEFILGAAPPADGWLRWAARAPREAERFAVGVWNAFVADCGAPESFRLPGRSLRLHELAILRDAGDRRGDRLWFADQQPWAARALMQSPFGEGKFREIQVNRANAVGISAKLLCCCGREDCDKAKRLARRMPRYRAVADLDFVFGDPERQADSQARALLFEVLEKDGVGAFDRVVENPRLARRQLDRSVETALAGLEAAPNVGYTMGAILFRTMLWSRFDPAEVDCGALARGLAAVSADSLAAFVARRRSDPAFRTPDDKGDLDVGMLAFLNLVGGGARPILTGRQLTNFVTGAARAAVHRVVTASTLFGEEWPEPPGLPAAMDKAGMGEAEIVFLRDAAALAKEGEQMQNCLREGWYRVDALLGKLVIFAIDNGRSRATLSVAAVHRAAGSGLCVERYEIAQLKSVANAPPVPACAGVAKRLVAELNSRCPTSLPREEAMRRSRIRRAIDGAKSYNRDTGAAIERWESYRRLLPRRFAGLSPSDVVDRYLHGGETD